MSPSCCGGIPETAPTSETGNKSLATTLTKGLQSPPATTTIASANVSNLSVLASLMLQFSYQSIVTALNENESSQASANASAACKPTNDSLESSKTHACGLRKRKGAKNGQGLPEEACGKHMLLVRDRYMDTLAAFGCVCKAMLARGLQSCCTPQAPVTRSLSASLIHSRGAGKRKYSISSCAGSCCENESVKSRSRISVDSCDKGCCAGPSVESKHSIISCVNSCCQNGSAKSGSRVAADTCRKGCCAEPIEEKVASKASGTSCCAGDMCIAESLRDIRARPRSKRTSVDSCALSCCKDSVVGDHGDVEQVIGALTTSGAPAETNHAVLAIKGMTCTGCENMLIRALHAQATITNVKTSLVLSRAEFDYVGRAAELRVLMDAVQKRTGFVVEEIEAAPSARALDLLVDGRSQEKFLLTAQLDGIVEVTQLDKKTVRVLYDPRVLGARDVLAHYASFLPALALEPEDPALTAGKKHVQNLLARTFLSAVLTIPVLIMTWAPLPDHATAYAIASLVLASTVQIVITGPFYVRALKSLFFAGLVEIDLLIVLSTTTAYVYSVVAFAFEMAGRPLSGGSFFETSTLLVTLIMCGQLTSAFARQRAVAAISLRSLQHKTATLVVNHWDGRVEEQSIDARLLHYDDVFRVTPNSVIITDGVVLSGSSNVDESMMTGESVSVEKTVGSEVLAGTVNGAGSLMVKVTRLPGENTISEIASMVDDARISRARIQSIVDRVCAWFVPIVLVLATITFVIWILVGIHVRKQSSGEATVKAITYAIAVLAISCPCAIGLAVPMVVLVASGVAARLGMVFKAATTIEIAKDINHVVFDKTGTLTLGRLEVLNADLLENDEETRSALWALSAASQHPVARAVSRYLMSTGAVTTSNVLDVKEVTGKGVEGTLDGKPIRGGNANWLGAEAHPSVQAYIASGLTVFCVTHDGNIIATFTLTDTLRPEAAHVMSTLSARGILISILSGDHAAVVDRVASTLGVPSERVRAGCLPADKAGYIRMLQAHGERVLFCGDGTNDAVALAQADIGVHMSPDSPGSSTGAAASSAADAILTRPSLAGIIGLMDLSTAVHRRIVLNFAWSAVYNLIAVLFAAGVFVDARISPEYAGLGEIVSVLPVVLVAMQLKLFKTDH
ncbi:hypothetical protein EIP86_006878 [Pleurotus ostreatoroseus]|nr:hypothetical protein EIP86_006878 [Pleurotus ostreatoroseus]